MEDITSPRVLRETLARYGLAPRKSLGQNFLIDANLRDKIVGAAALGPGDLALEVGPGPGALTSRLAAAGAAVLAVEADPGLARVLSDSLPRQDGQVAVVVGDILRLDLIHEVATRGWSGRPCVAVGNLPYYITTPVIFRFLETGLPWRRMVFLVQREVAARIVAAPGSKDYGLLSVMTQLRAEAEIITVMPPTAFWPPPKVHSALVRLTPPGRYALAGHEETILRGLARAAFGQRRKTLANACRVWTQQLDLVGGFAAACAQAGIDPARRGESLSVGEFAGLAAEIAAMLNAD